MSRLFKKAMDPISSETHFVGACLSLLGLIIMLILGNIQKSDPFIFGACIIFGLSLIALYSASSIYHYFNGQERIKKTLRKLDHSMIYVLIVGTYTPVVIGYMEPPHSFYFLFILWSLAFVGIFIKIFWMNAPRILSTSIYLILGWAIVFDIQSFQNVPIHCLALITIGGVAYSIGAIIYIIKKPNISIQFGFHELFHIFVMLGSFFHYLAIIMFIL